jgi:hypothetical protein
MKVEYLRRVSMAFAILAAAAGSGCGGINATKSISPLDFLLPGLTQNHSQPATNRGTNIVLESPVTTGVPAPQLASRQPAQP